MASLSVKNLFALTQDINLLVDYGRAETVFRVLHWAALGPFVLARVILKHSVI